jgi:hypothetical protein
MPQFPVQTPTVGELVEITLATGDKFPAYWDGLQWWMGVDNNPNDVPVTNGYVVSWGALPQN